MRTITIDYDVYNYAELSAEARENVKRWILSDDFRNDELYEMLKEDLKVLFNADLDVEYSLSYCQGDGLNIYGSISAEDFLKCIDDNNAGELSKRFKDYLTEKERRTILAYQNICTDIELPKNNRYAYSLSDRIDVVDEWQYQLEYAQYKNINIKTLEKFEKMVRDFFGELCAEFEKVGYNYLYEIDDEEVEEICEANNYEFTIDGEFFAA